MNSAPFHFNVLVNGVQVSTSTNAIAAAKECDMRAFCGKSQGKEETIQLWSTSLNRFMDWADMVR